MRVHRFQWIATQEYETFSCWLTKNADQADLYTSFHLYLESNHAAGREVPLLSCDSFLVEVLSLLFFGLSSR